MNKYKIEIIVLWVVNVMVLCVLLVLLLGIITSQYVINNDIWGPVSTFVGALIGAIITGGIAIAVNKNDNNKREMQQQEIAQKNLIIIKHYISFIRFEYIELQVKIFEFNQIKDPYEDIEFVVGPGGEEIPIYFPPQEWVDEYHREINPVKEKIKFISQQILSNYEKMEQIDITNLDLGNLDNYLNFISKFKATEIQALKKMTDDGYPQLTNIEIEIILKLLQIIS